MLPHVIDIVQAAFVLGRHISDNILLAQELFKGYDRESGPTRCALKVDLFKAFDSLHWDFVLVILRKMRFPAKFIDWIRMSICTPKFSIKLDGSLMNFFLELREFAKGTRCLHTFLQFV